MTLEHVLMQFLNNQKGERKSKNNNSVFPLSSTLQVNSVLNPFVTNKMIRTIVLFCLVSAIYCQASTDTIRLCTRPCSTGQSITQCVETFGSISSGDCTAPNAFPNCPPGTNSGPVRDLKASSGLNNYWKTVPQCETYRKRMLNVTNSPTVYQPKKQKRSLQMDPLQELLSRYYFLDQYSQVELSKVSAIIREKLPSAKRAAFDTNEAEIIKSVHGFYQFTVSYQNQTGVYTNSKCAGCSVMIQGILEKVTSQACDSIASTITSTLCATTGPFATFCGIFVDIVTKELESQGVATIGTMCQTAIREFVAGTGVEPFANDICSRVMCTIAQASNPTSKEQLTGNCNFVNQKVLNERCSQFLTIVQLADRGLCVSGNAIKIINAAKNPVDATIENLSNLVLGKTPPLVENVQEALKCSREAGNIIIGSASFARLSMPVLLLALLLAAWNMPW